MPEGRENQTASIGNGLITFLIVGALCFILSVAILYEGFGLAFGAATFWSILPGSALGFAAACVGPIRRNIAAFLFLPPAPW